MRDEFAGDWDYRELRPQVEVGRGCRIEGRHVFRQCRGAASPCVRLGNDVEIYTWTTFNLEPSGVVEVGDGSILVGAVLMCAGRITIGRGVVVSYNVTIADSDFHPHDVALRRADAIASAPFGNRADRPPLVVRDVVVGDGAWLGIGAIVLKGVTIGAGARVAACAVVASDVPAGAFAEGNPARIGPQGGGA